jgi:hypothetical protein
MGHPDPSASHEHLVRLGYGWAHHFTVCSATDLSVVLAVPIGFVGSFLVTEEHRSKRSLMGR